MIYVVDLMNIVKCCINVPKTLLDMLFVHHYLMMIAASVTTWLEVKLNNQKTVPNKVLVEIGSDDPPSLCEEESLFPSSIWEQSCCCGCIGSFYEFRRRKKSSVDNWNLIWLMRNFWKFLLGDWDSKKERL